MRITFAVTMVLFLAPAVYVVKYYAIDRPREETIARQTVYAVRDERETDPDLLLRASHEAKDSRLRADSRQAAIADIGNIVRRPGISYQRPLECLLAKATLSDLAAKDLDPAVRAAASLELGKVAENGAVIRR
jgi:hypothetical protein